MQRSTMFLVALFVVALAASAAIESRFFAQAPIEPGRLAQSARSGQVGPDGPSAVSSTVAQREPQDRGSDKKASPTSAAGAGAGALAGSAALQGDVDSRATSDPSLIVRFKAVQGLSSVASSSAVQTLSNVLLTDPAMRVRVAAVQSLVDIANADPDLAPAVLAALQAVANDSNNNVSVASRQAIATIE